MLVRRRRGLAARIAVLVASILVPATLSATGASAAGDPVVTVTPTTGLVDGQAVLITVKATTDVPVGAANARLCRAGVSYRPSAGSDLPDDFQADGPNCPRNPISSSSDQFAYNNNASQFLAPAGDTFQFLVGSGVINWQEIQGQKVTDRSLTCDVDHSCALVVELRLGDHWQPYVFTLAYEKIDPYAGCGGPAASVVETGGSDRMLDAWVAWTRQECAKPGRSGAATRASFVGEGNAVDSFAAGTIDVAYSAGGFDADMGLQSPPRPGQPSAVRNSVAVPVGINAAVLGISGGRREAGHVVPFRGIKLTLDQAAALVSGGFNGVPPTSDVSAAILAANPQLEGVFSLSGSFNVAAYAGVDATTWYTTRWLKTLAAAAWKVPVNATYFGTNGGRPRGIHNSFATAEPTFNNALDLQSGRPQFRRGVIGGSQAWAVTDLGTANALAFSPVQIQNARGDLVAPTPETLTAAVATMKLDDKGILVGDPTATAAPGAVQPYPLTMVEYAIVPAEPLVDEASCTARAGSQTVLKGWLDYVLGEGQAALPAGMVALPASLKASAQTALAKMGAAPVTGVCEGKVVRPASGSPLAPSPGDVATPGASPTGGRDGGNGALSGGAAPGEPGGALAGISPPSGYTTPAGAVAAPGAPEAALVAKSADSVSIPGFGGAGLASWVLTVAALLGIVILSSLAALGSSGKLGELRRRLFQRQ